jgi:hypothetical protein
LTETQQKRDPKPQWNLHAGFAAWALPGLGHLLLGQRKRGVIIMVTILTLWSMGLLLGGIGAVDRKPMTDGKTPLSWWFFCQSGNAANVIADQVLQRFFLHTGQPTLDNPVFEPSQGKLNEQGVLYTSLAGLLNILAILDVIYCDPKYRAALDQPKTPKPSQDAEQNSVTDQKAANEGAKV